MVAQQLTYFDFDEHLLLEPDWDSLKLDTDWTLNLLQDSVQPTEDVFPIDDTFVTDTFNLEPTPTYGTEDNEATVEQLLEIDNLCSFTDYTMLQKDAANNFSSLILPQMTDKASSSKDSSPLSLGKNVPAPATNYTYATNSTVYGPSNFKSRNAVGRFVVAANKSTKITLEESTIQCLSVLVNYHGYEGANIRVHKYHVELSNSAYYEHDASEMAAKSIALISAQDNQPSIALASLQRVRYTRDIPELYNTVSNLVYYESDVYHVQSPYEPQHYRFELDENGRKINGSKCGLCPYCKEVKFLPFKNSSYLSHLTLEHGIYSNNYLTPEGLYFGFYWSQKLDQGKITPKKIKAVQCPACYEVVEVCCWSIKSNPLLSYFRHFKKSHSGLTDGESFNRNLFVNIVKRGRTLRAKTTSK